MVNGGGMAVGSAITEYAIEQSSQVPDFWQMSDVELARSCVLVAESRSGPGNAPLRGEAMRLLLLWREAINAPRQRYNDRELGMATLQSLRKRTIQILVRLSLQGLLFIP